jgi:hypothetical protein
MVPAVTALSIEERSFGIDLLAFAHETGLPPMVVDNSLQTFSLALGLSEC